MAAHVEETLKRIEKNPGVIGTVIISEDGIPIRSTLNGSATVQYSQLFGKLHQTCASTVRELDATDEVQFMRIRTKRHHVLVASEKNYIMVVLQTIKDDDDFVINKTNEIE